MYHIAKSQRIHWINPNPIIWTKISSPNEKWFTWWTICGPNDGIRGLINVSYDFWQYDTPYWRDLRVSKTGEIRSSLNRSLSGIKELLHIYCYHQPLLPPLSLLLCIQTIFSFTGWWGQMAGMRFRFNNETWLLQAHFYLYFLRLHQFFSQWFHRTARSWTSRTSKLAQRGNELFIPTVVNIAFQKATCQHEIIVIPL